MAQFALRWILMFPQVSLAIPGAKNRLQATANAAAADLPALDDFSMRRCAEIYNQYIRLSVHQRW
jgi:aryl-alcohol dehydrogenase-like predicted oxidoreductase